MTSIINDALEGAVIRPQPELVVFDSSAPSVPPLTAEPLIRLGDQSGVTQQSAQPNAAPAGQQTVAIALSSPQTAGVQQPTVTPVLPQPTTQVVEPPITQTQSLSGAPGTLSEAERARRAQLYAAGYVQSPRGDFVLTYADGTSVSVPQFGPGAGAIAGQWASGYMLTDPNGNVTVYGTNTGAVATPAYMAQVGGGSLSLSYWQNLVNWGMLSATDIQSIDSSSFLRQGVNAAQESAIAKGFGSELTPEQLDNIQRYGSPDGLSIPPAAAPVQGGVVKPGETSSGMPTRPQPMELVQTRDPYNPSLPPDLHRPMGTGLPGPGGQVMRPSSAVTVTPTGANMSNVSNEPPQTNVAPLTQVHWLLIGVAALFGLSLLVRSVRS